MTFHPLPRYLGRPKAEQTVLVRPPFLRPEVSDGQITVKIMDNGIQTELKRTKVRKVGTSAVCAGALHGAQGCKPASVSREPSEPGHVPCPPPCRLVLCPCGMGTVPLPCGSDHMRLCPLHCPYWSHPSPHSTLWRFPLLGTSSTHPGRALPPVLSDGPGGSRSPPVPLSMPCQPGGAEAEAPPDPSCALSLQSKGSLEVTESQSADAEPPPPPKPDLSRYTGLRTHLTLATTEGKEGTRALAAAGRGSPGLHQAGQEPGP